MVNELYNCPLHYEIVNPIDPKNEICELDWVGPAIFCNTVCMKRNATYFLYITLCLRYGEVFRRKSKRRFMLLRDEHPILVLPFSTIHLRNSVTVYWYVRTYVVSVLFCSFSLFYAPSYVRTWFTFCVRWVMERYRDRVPVRTIDSGTRYDGKVWYEPLASIRSINGSPTSNVEKSMLNPGDRVTVVFNNRTYSGVVDPPGDEEVQEESGRSPTKSSHPHRARRQEKQSNRRPIAKT